MGQHGPRLGLPLERRQLVTGDVITTLTRPQLDALYTFAAEHQATTVTIVAQRPTGDECVTVLAWGDDLCSVRIWMDGETSATEDHNVV